MTTTSQLFNYIKCNDDNEALALITAGEVDLDYQDNYGNTALHCACIFDRPEIMLALIATGKSNPGAQNINGNTVLHVICTYLHSPIRIKIILELLATGESNPNCKNKYKLTALDYARKYYNFEIINILQNACDA